MTILADGIPTDLLGDALIAREDVARSMRGRMGDAARPAAAVAAAISVLGGGNYFETGVLWGGSLLTTALLRKRYGIVGDIVGVDPFNGYYMQGPAQYAMPNSRMPWPVSVETVLESARSLGLESMIELVAKQSHPAPAEVAGREFSVAFLDGGHWGEGPYLDWVFAESAGCTIVGFDNYPEGSGKDGILDIEKTVVRIAEEHPAWALAGAFYGVAVMVRA